MEVKMIESRYAGLPAKSEGVSLETMTPDTPENRQMQAYFECQRCGLTGPADVIAGINIKAAGQALLGSVPSAEGAVTVCGETGLPASVKQKPVESRETAPLLT